ncbi:MAG: beta-galactosidase [Eubacteriales bacterium]
MFRADKCYDLLQATGVKYARCQTGWAKCEKVKGVYDFAWLDSIVDNLLQRGIIPWFNVGFGNPLYMPGVPNETAVGCVPLFYGEEATAAWKNFVFALAEHYRSRVTHFEIWNEPNIGHFWYPESPDGAGYAELVRLTASIIRKAVPDAKIGADISQPYDFAFAEAFLDHIEKRDIDFFAYHAYSSIPEFRYLEAVSFLRRMLDERGMQDVELWQGEAGYPSWAYKGHWLVPDGCDSERAQAVWQLRRYFLDVAGGARRSSFFQMADMWEKPYAKAVEQIQKPAAHGILHGITYTPKKSYETIRNLAAVFQGDIRPSEAYMHVDFNTPSALELLSLVHLSFEKNGFPVYAYYLPERVSQSIDIPYQAEVCVCHKFDDPVLIDLYTSEVYEVDDVAYEHGLVRYRNLPIRDYPLMLAERSSFKYKLGKTRPLPERGK